MSLAKKLNKNLENTTALSTKKVSIDLGEIKFDLRVRVPLKKQMEEMNAKILSPDQERVNKIYDGLAKPIMETLEAAGKEFVDELNKDKQTIVVAENDLIVDGTSLRQLAQFQAIEEQRVEAYFRLLQSETGEPVNETFEQITEEFPEFVIREIIVAIQAALTPDYKTTKKN